MKMPSRIFNLLTTKKDTNSKPNNDFEKIMSFAKKIVESEHPLRIYELVYSLGKPYQFEIINMCIKGKPISNELYPFIEHLFLKNNYKNYKLYKENEEGKVINYTSVIDKKIHPSEFLIFAFPWNEDRLMNAFNDIGVKVDNVWKNDSLNHRVIHISPLNIGYVHNGHHSTVMNIINNESTMEVTEQLNLSPIYDEIYTDGIFFRKIVDNSIIAEVTNVEFAAIFEIGRLLNNKPICEENTCEKKSKNL